MILFSRNNGEPKSGVLIDFRFDHLYYNSERSKCLKTDKFEAVHLGRLKNILISHNEVLCYTKVKQNNSFTQKDMGLSNNSHLNYPDGKQLTILKTEKVRLPFEHIEIKPTNF